MKVRLRILTLILPIFIFAECIAEDSPTVSNSKKAVSSSNNNLVYFGFAVVDGGLDDPHDNSSKTNYIDEVGSFTNVAQMAVFSPTESLKPRLSKFKKAGVKAILHIEPLLFESKKDSNSPSGFKISLRSNAKKLWKTFVTINKKVLTPSNIAALYVIDEPVWNGVSLKELTFALKLVKDELPDIPTMSIEAYPVVKQIMIPESLDWIGFDRYDSVDPKNDKAWLADLETVRKARTRKSQKIVIVASTQWLPFYLKDAGIHPKDMEKIAWSYYYVAKSQPDVIALVGYLWPGGLDDPKQLGARNLPDNVKKALRKMGREITKKK